MYSVNFKHKCTCKLQTGRGKVSLDELRALANHKPTPRYCIEESDLENLDDEVLSGDDFEETEEVSLKQTNCDILVEYNYVKV